MSKTPGLAIQSTTGHSSLFSNKFPTKRTHAPPPVRTSVITFGRKKGSKKGGGKSGSTAPKNGEDPNFGLENLDPVRLGRKSRQAFDDLWMQFTKLATPTLSFSDSSLLGGIDFDTPDTAFTRVLVVGATGRVGKILVRKLLLRGYQVKALVRDRKGFESDLPPAVDVVQGDIADYEKCRKAVDGVDKVIYAAGARSLMTADIRRVEEEGVLNVARALQDYKRTKAVRRGATSKTAKKEIADFKFTETVEAWKVREVGSTRGKKESRGNLEFLEYEDGGRLWKRGFDTCELKENMGNLWFTGDVVTTGGIAEVGGPVAIPQGDTLENCEGLIMRIRGDANTYAAVLTTKSGTRYVARFPTRFGYNTIRLPFNTFRPETTGGGGPLDPLEVSDIGIRFENKAKANTVKMEEGGEEKSAGEFSLEIDYMKALPGGQETDFLLISCAGLPREGLDGPLLQTFINAKRGGEAKLKNTGLGYTVIRPTTLIDEPGGFKALVFDQGNRLEQGISPADVADVCVRALHQPLARNKTFEVAHEYTPEDGLEMYELVAHVPDKSTNYLGAALVNLEKNT